MISQFDILARLGAAALLGSLVGLERERLMWAAGVRTHMLVAVGACLFMIVSAYGFEHARTLDHVILDPSRIAAQVVSGIGFLGAGSILLRGQVIRGLTTAASIWSVAALGLACGGGLYFAASATTAIILIILIGIKPLEEMYRVRVQSASLQVTTRHDALSSGALRKLMSLRSTQIRRVTIEQHGGEDQIKLQLVRVSRTAVDAAIAALKAHADVSDVTLLSRESYSGS